MGMPVADAPRDEQQSSQRNADAEHAVNRDLLELPGGAGLAGEMTKRLAGRVGQPAAAANPRTIPALAKKNCKHRDHQEGTEKAVENERQRHVKDDPGHEIVELQRPQIAEIKLRLVK